MKPLPKVDKKKGKGRKSEKVGLVVIVEIKIR